MHASHRHHQTPGQAILANLAHARRAIKVRNTKTAFELLAEIHELRHQADPQLWNLMAREICNVTRKARATRQAA